MLTVKQILDAIETQLEMVFPGVQQYRNQVPANFDRPSMMTRISGLTMAMRTNTTVQRTALATVTLFCSVDDYHNTDVDALYLMADKVMEHFSAPVLPAADRYLDIGRVSCNPQADYAEITIPLEWDDDRVVQREEHEMMQSVHLRME